MSRMFRAMRGRYDLAAAAAVVVGLVAVVATSDVPEVQVSDVLRVLTVWGFAEELLVALLGVVAIAFLAGSGRKKGVAITGALLIVLSNATMLVPGNRLSSFPTDWGFNRPTLNYVAATSPNPAISEELPMVLLLGATIGDAELVMPLRDFGDRVRALTDIEPVFDPGPYQPPSADWDEQRIRQVGVLGETPVAVVGSAGRYLWLDRPDGIFVVAVDEDPS